MKKALLLPIICITLMASNCVGKKAPTQTTSTKKSDDVIHLGFNAKAILQTQEQTSMARDLFSQIKKAPDNPIYIRIPGGTPSMRYTSKDFTDAQLRAWINLQKSFNIEFIYVVNGNDTPQGQEAHIDRWINMGAEFAFIEMMNEYYLPKFFKGDTSKPEVSRKVLVQDYVQDILPSFIKRLKKYNKPLYLIAAPEKSGKQGERTKHWNQVLAANFSQFDYTNLGITIHLYQRGDKKVHYNQIHKLRSMFPTGTPIAVTEAGVLDERKNLPEKTYNHYQKIYKYLKPGDTLLDQVLYTNYRRTKVATLHPLTKGITPKGQKVLAFINERR